MSLPPVNEHPSEASFNSDFEEFFEGILLWPRGRGCCGRCLQSLGGVPLRFQDPSKELTWRQQHRQRLTRATRRVGKVALVVHLLAVLADLSMMDFANLTQAQLRYTASLSIMAILALMQIFCTIPEVGVSVIYVLASVSLMLTSRSRAAFLAGMDLRSAWVPELPSSICLCDLSSDSVLVGNFACVILVYFVVMPVRSAVSVWCMPLFSLAYLALSVPVPDADGDLVRKLNLAFRILICAFVGLLGRCWIEIGERASFLRLQSVQKDLTKEKVLRAVAEHEMERGPFSSNSTPQLDVSNIGPMPCADDLQSDVQSGVTSGMSRPLSSIVFTPRAGHAAPVAMQLKAMKAMAAEEKWLIDWPDITFQSNLLGKGGFALVLEGSYAGAKVAVKLPLGDQLTTTTEVLDFCGKELRVLRRLRHPSIVSFYGACIEESRCLVLIVEEFIDGLSLFDAVLNKNQDVFAELSEGKRREILEIICQALVYLHDQGPSILHGDLSPKNVLLRSASLTPVLVDFGMSVLRKSHQTMAGGSPQWMAPELLCSLEAGGLKPDCSLDIFSFGRISFFVSTGRLPFPRRSIGEVLEAAKSGPTFSQMPWPLEDVTELQMFCQEEICPRCLDCDPKQRFSAEETLAMFRRYSPQTPVLGEERPMPRPTSLNSVLQVVDQVSVSLRSGYLSTINAEVVAQRKKKIPL